MPDDTFPDDMDSTAAYDWITRAVIFVEDAEMPEPIRKYVLAHLNGARHYCVKYDVVHPWGFDLDEHKLVAELVGPYPIEKEQAA